MAMAWNCIGTGPKKNGRVRRTAASRCIRDRWIWIHYWRRRNRNKKRTYTGAMRAAWKKIRYRLEWLGVKTAAGFLPLLSRKAFYRLALLLGSLGAVLDRRGRRVALSNLRVAFGDEISAEGRAQ